MPAYDFKSLAVLGAGAWGTALAQVAAQAGLPVSLWGRDMRLLEAIANTRTNEKYLPDIELSELVTPVKTFTDCAAADLMLLVTPAQSIREICTSLSCSLKKKTPIVVCAKGIERETEKFLCEIVEDVLPDNPVAILSGPSFAKDVARGLPTAVTIAAKDTELAKAVGACLATQSFRLYYSDDVRGVEIGGATKNVLAIACGIAEGCGLGASANAALIARGFAEMRRFGAAFGAGQETMMGLSGLGDLVLTCGSVQSRNFALGYALSAGQKATESTLGTLAEGAYTARVLVSMAQKKGVDLPIAQSVDAILSGKLTVHDAVARLMNRPQKSEGITEIS